MTQSLLKDCGDPTTVLDLTNTASKVSGHEVNLQKSGDQGKAQSIKCLRASMTDLSSTPSTHIKSWAWRHSGLCL